ncbi:MAG: hypothetical protein QG610_1378 [Euryarchaeota archaeon]|nr:hypothetical protein [Euryarchaeota archaeon]
MCLIYPKILRKLLRKILKKTAASEFSDIRHWTGVSKTFTNKGFGFMQNGYVFILFERKFILRFINQNPKLPGSQKEILPRSYKQFAGSELRSALLFFARV